MKLTLLKIRTLALAALLSFHLPVSAQPLPSGLRAGAATMVITPAIGTVMNGGTAPAISTHVHDDLHARALVVDDGATRIAFVVVDNWRCRFIQFRWRAGAVGRVKLPRSGA